MRELYRIALVAAALMGAAPAAHAQMIGSSLRQVANLYARAAPVQIDGAAALELRDIEYAGLHWSRVDFVFDREQRLSRMQMTTTAASYDAVLKVASQQLESPPDAGSSLAGDTPDSFQVRVCEGDAGAVTVTYEPYTSNS